MAKCIMVQGTTSGAGKSLLTAGLCRIFSRMGYRTAPFKSQNMALNSFITADGREMGRAQVMQAQCASIPPDVRMNPILLKPNSDTGSQVIVNGRVLGNMRAADYFAFKQELIPMIRETYASLAAENDVIVLEGAGSPAEINLKQQDIVNMGLAKMVGAPVLLVADIHPGGVFASLAGTIQLLEPDERDYVKGVIINKFRGDLEILKPGLVMLEDIIHKPVLGVVPFMELDVDDEDSISQRLTPKGGGIVDIAVIRLPRLSNFTDFSPLAAISGVSVRYVDAPGMLENPDLIILPGTKNTMGDLAWLRKNGLESKILAHVGAGKPVFGVCGGYQMLGTALHDPYDVEHGSSMLGLGLLELETTFLGQKTQTQVTGLMRAVPGIFSALSGQEFCGYEIHMGETKSAAISPLCTIRRPDGSPVEDGAAQGNIYGTYVHGIFDATGIAAGIVTALLRAKGLTDETAQSVYSEAYREQQYDLLADTLEQSLDMDSILTILETGSPQPRRICKI